MLSAGFVVTVSTVGGGSLQLYNHNCSGTAPQVTQQGCQQCANASGCKVGVELRLGTNGIQFNIFARKGRQTAFVNLSKLNRHGFMVRSQIKK